LNGQHIKTQQTHLKHVIELKKHGQTMEYDLIQVLTNGTCVR